jgi:hypothetical protein
MQVKFFLGYDDRMKLLPILEHFGTKPFTKSGIISQNIVPDLTSGDITRWGGNSIIKKVYRPGERSSPNVWRLTGRTISALERGM